MLPRVSEPNLRRAVRAFLLDPSDRVLLVRWHFEDPDGPVDVWGAPGGGIDDGEAPEAAIRRELLEETGLDLADCGACVAHRRHVIPMRYPAAVTLSSPTTRPIRRSGRRTRSAVFLR